MQPFFFSLFPLGLTVQINFKSSCSPSYKSSEDQFSLHFQLKREWQKQEQMQCMCWRSTKTMQKQSGGQMVSDKLTRNKAIFVDFSEQTAYEISPEKGGKMKLDMQIAG